MEGVKDSSTSPLFEAVCLNLFYFQKGVRDRPRTAPVCFAYHFNVQQGVFLHCPCLRQRTCVCVCLPVMDASGEEVNLSLM